MNGGIEVILGELIELVQATAPALWAMARRQVMAYHVSNTLWGAFFFLVAIALGLVARYSKRLWAKEEVRSAYDYNDWTPENTEAAACVGIVGALVVGILCFHKVVMYSINPDYYAIKVLLELVR